MRVMKSLLRTALAVAIVLGAVLSVTVPAKAEAPANCTLPPEDPDSLPVSDGGITPYYCTGNPTCGTLGYTYGWRVDEGDFASLDDGQFFNMLVGWPPPGDPKPTQFGFETYATNSTPGYVPPSDPTDPVVKITSADGIFFAWASNLFPIAAVIVKGGPNANDYDYLYTGAGTDWYGDSGLASPIKKDEPYGISHIDFCWNGDATYVRLAELTASAGADGVTVAWSTAVEVDNAGFNLYRQAPDGTLSQLNASLIATNGGAGGASYSYLDPAGTADDVYILEDVDFGGTATQHGPVQAVAEIADHLSHALFLPMALGR